LQSIGLNSKNFIVINAILLLVSWTYLQNNGAYGHANPVSYFPSSNSSISKESPPEKVTILFSERPEPKVSYIHVTNSKNERVDNNDYKVTGQNGREVTVTLDKTKLSDGVHTVSWLTLSRDDGHITKGTYVFNIQSPEKQQLEAGSISTGQQNILEQARVDNVNMTLGIAPLQVGQNIFNVTLTNQSGNPATNVVDVILSFTNKEVGLGPIVANLNNTGEGRFAANGSYISQPGKWEIKVTAQRSGAYDLNHTFKIPVNATTST
jgi:methionine-rich copper-binding protein CopC